MSARDGRRVVLVFALVALGVKLWLAATTFGTDDVMRWIDFTRGVREFGVFDMYGREYVTVYNHPPFAGMWLIAVNWLVESGVSDVPFLIRGPSSVADLVTTLLVFELVRLHRSVREATAAGVLISLSPALIVISGFHGNTDSVFVMFSLLAVYLVMKDHSFSAGVAIGLAMSVKLVPIVVVPVMVVWLVGAGWRRLRAFASGALVVFVVLWVPHLVVNGSAFRRDVLGYAGAPERPWGLSQFAVWADLPGVTVALDGPGRFVALLVAGLVPAVLVWRRPRSFVPAVGLSFVLFLLLSPAFGMQYLSWSLAAAYLIRIVPATAYNLAASLFVLWVYSEWSGGGWPWAWDEAPSTSLSSRAFAFMVGSWVALAWVAGAGVWTAVRRDEDRAAVSPEPRAGVDGGAAPSTEHMMDD